MTEAQSLGVQKKIMPNTEKNIRAIVVEFVDTKCLKSMPFIKCKIESAWRVSLNEN